MKFKLQTLDVVGLDGVVREKKMSESNSAVISHVAFCPKNRVQHAHKKGVSAKQTGCSQNLERGVASQCTAELDDASALDLILGDVELAQCRSCEHRRKG